ncbi:MAG: 1-phosphofructokinase family hexose kinase [Eubacteriales bacterium]
MKAVTLTLNPALDKAMYFSSFNVGELNRSDYSLVTLGSKGINISRVLRLFGADAPALGFEGGDNGRVMMNMLDGEGISHRFVHTAAPTRMNVKLISGSTCTEANEKGGPITPEEAGELLSLLERETKEADCIFLGGSIPSGMERDIYARLVEMARANNCQAFLDCDGKALEYGLEARPYMIKPNLYELDLLTGDTTVLPRDKKAFDKAVDGVCRRCMDIYKSKGTRVICTLGGDGALYAGPEGGFYVSSPRVELRGFAGAGDTFLASFCAASWGYAKETAGDTKSAMRFASSAAASKVELEGTTLPRREDMGKFLDKVSVRVIM